GELGLRPAEASSQILQRDRHAEFMSALAITAATLDKFALEIRHLARTEVREVEEPFGQGQKGSSAMPHKRNPVICERVCGLAREDAYRIVQGAAGAAWDRGADFRSELLGDPQVRERLAPDDLDALLDPLPHIANLGGVFDRLHKLEVSGE